MLSHASEPGYIGWHAHLQTGFGGSFLTKRVSEKGCVIFLTLDSERASKAASNGIYSILITD